MRQALVKALLTHVDNDKFVFLTGDLGYKALEPLQTVMGSRFINAGIAEQNMVSVAAGLAFKGERPWVYSIAPFLYKRAFEQIHNDVCMPCLPVMMVGNGAGYGYGVMGPSHHAINDYGIMLTLPYLKCLIPAFASDVAPMVEDMMTSIKPVYLRLGAAEEPKEFVNTSYYPWRRVIIGDDKSPVVVVVGSIAGTYLNPLYVFGCSMWVVSELPSEIPDDFFAEFNVMRDLIILEEHIAQGSFGQCLLSLLAGKASEHINKIIHRCALGYPSGSAGSKEFHRKESGIDPASVVGLLQSLR